MTFPLSQFDSGTLCGNIALSLQAMTPIKRPLTDEVFSRIDRLYQLCNFHLGSVQEIGRCAALLTEKRTPTDRDKNLQKKLISYSLLFAKQSEKIQSPINLCQGLDAKRRDPPELADLINAIWDLTISTHLKIYSFTHFEMKLLKLYPVEERSEKEYAAWKDFEYFVVNSEDKELQDNYELSENWRKEVSDVRKSGRQSPEDILKAILEVDAYKNSTKVERSKILQLLLNGLLAEERNCSRLDNLCDRFQRFYSKDQTYCSYEQRAEQCSNSFDYNIGAFIELQDSHLWPKLHDYYINLMGQLGKTNSFLYHLKLPSNTQEYETRFQSLFVKLSKLRSKALAELPFIDVPPAIWKEFSNLIVKKLDYLIFCRQTLCSFYCLASHCHEIYKVQNIDAALAKCALPALSLINEEYVSVQLKKYMNEVMLFWKLTAAIDPMAELIKTTGENRKKLFCLLRKKLEDQLPKKGQARRMALQHTKILIGDGDQAQLLPLSLTPDEEPSSKNSALEICRIESDRSLVEKESKSPPPFAVLDDLGMIPWSRLKIGMQKWRPPFVYHFRVRRWFKAHLPLSQVDFPEYWQRSGPYQNRMIQLHRLIPLADFFCQKGWVQSSASNQGDLIKRLILPAELEMDKESLNGLIVWAVNAQNICYHRFFHVRIESVDISQTLRESFKQSQVLPQMSEKVDSASLEFNDCDQQSAEIDQLLGVATLKDQNLPGCTLRLKFKREII